jgi:hypothetical protein
VLGRYKTSNLSGDEWRFSYRIDDQERQGGRAPKRRKHEVRRGRVSRCTWASVVDMDQAWTILPWKDHPGDGICCQPGCANKAKSTYVMKKRYDRSCVFEMPNEGLCGQIDAREFCNEHRQRGDCGLDDANANYVCVKGKDWNGAPVDPAKVSESLLVTDPGQQDTEVSDAG